MVTPEGEIPRDSLGRGELDASPRLEGSVRIRRTHGGHSARGRAQSLALDQEGVDAQPGNHTKRSEAEAELGVRGDIDEVSIESIASDIGTRRLTEGDRVALARRERQRAGALDSGELAERVYPEFEEARSESVARF